MNILATYHPADKDYGLMKIDEPSTPYNRMVGDEDDEGALSDSDGHSAPTADDLASKIAAAENIDPRFMREEEEESSEEEEEELSAEEQAKRSQFQMMRKMHYNEGMNIKLARQLIEDEEDEDEDEDEEMRDVTEEAREEASTVVAASEEVEEEEGVEETEDIHVDPPQEAESLDS
ncbi:hypothetical protein CRUP_028822 [Coryphaenoides rupestris]|nr:hypothetical protein CRUP_028822 [Coryphaenoides rupestris]